MKAFVICMAEYGPSIEAASQLLQSSISFFNPFKITSWDAVVAKEARTELNKSMLKWTYPWQGYKNDIATGLKLSAYQTNNPDARIACFMSHFHLWNYCVKINEPVLILEHDAVFIRALSQTALDAILDSRFGVIGINDPRGATRKSGEYHNQIQEFDTEEPVIPVPKIDELNIPQGLAGNSAYIIKPNAAVEVIAKAREVGAWPNDALMCYQNFSPSFLGVTKQYYTQVQGTTSTTTQQLEMPFS